MIHKRILVFLIAFLPVIISACSDDDDDDLIGKWYRVSDMDGLARNYASSFTIGNKGYLICGNDGKNRLSDSSDDDYTITRTNGVAFVIDGAAYLTCGESGSLRSDTWKYYPGTDLWENVAKFKGTARTATASFSSGEKGFVVSGKSGTTQFDDIWEFHPNEYDDDEY